MIAEQTGLSKYHFHRLFVKENNCTPQVYLEKLRLEHASHFMILFPKISLIEVAFECGYSSPACFSRAFKKYYSTSPSKYRIQKSILKTATKEKNRISVQYLPTKTIEVQKVRLIEKELSQAYKSLFEQSNSSETIGFYLDMPFHIPPEKCRHYIGINQSVPKNISDVLTMPAGYYTSMSIVGNFSTLKEKLYNLRSQIENSGYTIDSIIGYEKILLPKEILDFDYFQIERELLIKIKRK